MRGMSLAGGALLLGAASALLGLVRWAPDWPSLAWAVAIALVAWPIWCWQVEQRLFERRVVLDGLLLAESRLRRVLWSGHVARAIQVLVALAWAAVLLALGALAGPWHWGVALGDALLLGLLLGPAQAWLARDARPEYRAIAARRWPLLWLNVGVLAISFFAVDYFIAGAPDTRGMAWVDVAERAHAAAVAAHASSEAGAVIGFVAAVDALAWHAAEVLIPSLPNRGMRLAAWVIFLLQAGLFAIAFTRLLLGVAAIAEPRPDARPWRTYAAMVLAVAGVLHLALPALRAMDFGGLAGRVAEWADPCRGDPKSLAVLEESLGQEVKALQVAERRALEAEAAARLDALFKQAEARVDGYLDWYFSLVGEYARLGAAITGRLGESMQEELERRVFGETFSAGVAEAGRVMSEQSRARVADAAGGLARRMRASVAAKPCLAGRIDLAPLATLERDAQRAGVAAGAGAVVGATVLVLARQAARRAATRAASQRAFQGAASLAGRTVAKRGGSLGLAAACGPAAPLCALVAAGVTWIALDKAMIEIDELRLRDEMRAELVASIHAQRDSLAAELVAQLAAAADADIARVHAEATRVFVPARSGPRPAGA